MTRRDEYELTFGQVIAFSERDFFVLAYRNYVDQPDRNWSEVLYCDGTRWKVVADLPDVWLTHLCAAAPGTVIGLDIYGTIYRCTREGCWRLDINIHGANALIALGTDAFYLVGDRGACHRVFEGRVERIDLGISKQLSGIWGASEDDLTIVGRKGTCLRLRCGNVEKENAATDKDLNLIFGDLSGQRVATGLDGLTRLYDGRAWQPIETDIPWGITGIAFDDDGSVVCAGYDLIRITSGAASLELDAAQFSTNLYGVARLGPGRFLAVGTNQTVLIGPPWRAYDVLPDPRPAASDASPGPSDSAGENAPLSIIRSSLDRLGDVEHPSDLDRAEVLREVKQICELVHSENVLASLDAATAGDKVRQRAAIYVLAQFAERPDVAARLSEMLKPTAHDRLWLVLGIAHGPLPQLAGFLNGIVANEPHEAIARAAMHAIGEMKCDINLPVLVELASRDVDDLEGSILSALKEYAVEACRPALRKAYEAPPRKRSEIVRIGELTTTYDKTTAAWGLAKLGDAEAIQHLADLVGAPDAPLPGGFALYAAARAAKALCDVYRWPQDDKAEKIIEATRRRLLSLRQG